jgi:nitrogen fixation NifU-like protein
MDDVGGLYQEVIVDHYRHPRNFRKLEGATHAAEGFNPLCGDRVTLYLRVKGGSVEEAAFQGTGCALSQASASLLTESVKGKRVAEAEALFDRFHRLAKGEGAGGDVGKLAIFEGVGRFPMRVKCVTLPWHAFLSALRADAKRVSTE